MNDIDRCVEEIVKAYATAQKKLGVIFPFPHIKWDLRGTCAGKADYYGNIIRLNPILLRDNPDAFVKRTPAHEVAHLLAFRTSGPRIEPHGVQWRRMCWMLGISATRCHSYDTSAVTGRRIVIIGEEIM